MDFGLGKSHAHGEHAAMPLFIHANRHQDGTIPHAAGQADLLDSCASKIRYLMAPSGRLRHLACSSSIKAAARLTSLEEISQPHNSSVIFVTLLVETPCTYISAKASRRAFSLRDPALQSVRIELHAADLRHG